MRDSERQDLDSAGARILRAGGIPDQRIRELEQNDRSITIASAMGLVAMAERMAAGGLTPEEIDALLPALAEMKLAAPLTHADAVAAIFRRLTDLGIERDSTVKLASCAARAETAEASEFAESAEASVRAALDAGASAAATGRLMARCVEESGGNLRSGVESALRRLRAPTDAEPSAQEAVRRLIAEPKGGWSMTDPKMRNGSGPNGSPDRERERERLEREREALDREREKMDRERERADREREKLDRERERLDRIQEELEARLERQEERLEELEEQLEERMEALDEAAAGLDDIEVDGIEGIEGIREVLDAVTDRMPGIVRGIQESIYAPERIQATAEAFAVFYKTLVAAGMSDHEAAELTREHFDKLQSQMQPHVVQRRSARTGRGGSGPDVDPLGPDFDPIGPDFDPLRGKCCPPTPPAPPDPAEPRSD